MSVPNSAIKWLLGSETGTSSKTMFAVLAGEVQPGSRMKWRQDIPHDFDDFGRCYRLVLMVPEWKDRLAEIPEYLPAWKPVIQRWDELVRMYLSPKNRDYHVWKIIYDESFILDGWKREGGGWRRDETPGDEE